MGIEKDRVKNLESQTRLGPTRLHMHTCAGLVPLQIIPLCSQPIVPQHSTHQNLSPIGTILWRTILGRIVRHPIFTRYENHRSRNPLARKDAIVSFQPSVSVPHPNFTWPRNVSPAPDIIACIKEAAFAPKSPLVLCSTDRIQLSSNLMAVLGASNIH